MCTTTCWDAGADVIRVRSMNGIAKNEAAFASSQAQRLLNDVHHHGGFRRARRLRIRKLSIAGSMSSDVAEYLDKRTSATGLP